MSQDFTKEFTEFYDARKSGQITYTAKAKLNEMYGKLAREPFLAFDIDDSSVKRHLEAIGLTEAEQELWLNGRFDIGIAEPISFMHMCLPDIKNSDIYMINDKAKFGFDPHHGPITYTYGRWAGRAQAKAIARDKRRKANKAARKARKNG